MMHSTGISTVAEKARDRQRRVRTLYLNKGGSESMKVINLSTFQVFSAEKMKKNNIFQTPRFFCDVYCFEPGQEQKGHVHGEQDKVYVVLEGRGTFAVGGEHRVLGRGEATIAMAGAEHGVLNHT